jgi:hypothetical protein
LPQTRGNSGFYLGLQRKPTRNYTCMNLSTGTYALTFMATGDPIPHKVQFQVR